MTQSINTTTKAACLQATPAFQLPAARARPGPGEGIPGWLRPSGPPGLLSNPGSQAPRGGLAQGCAWGALGQGHTEGTPKAHIQHRGFGSDPHALRMRGGRGYAANSLQHAHPDPAHIRGRAGCVRCRRPEAGRRGRCWGCRCGWGEIHARAYARPCYRPHARAGARTHIRVWPSALGEDLPIGKACPNRVSRAGC